MDILEVLDQVRALLQREGRVSYRLLKRQFALDDEALEDLKFELVEIQELATDKDGKMLVWAGATPVSSDESRVASPPPSPIPSTQHPTPKPPVSYTPAHLADRIRAVAVTDSERKTITALFADLKGSTALIEGLDPEEARTILDPALQLMMDAVHQYDGFVAQALGDGIFALFGAPLAHEDHPQRALYAALRMQDTMRRYADTLRQQGYPPLLMRVGLNTGEVVLRSIHKDDLHADYVPVGHSTNLAARMEQLATPGSIVVSAHTHKLTDGYFTFKDLGQTQIKGVTDALNIYELQGVGQLRTRLQVSASRYGLTRFVGRQNELEQLKRALERAQAGQGQIIGTMGEAGLGKSRLFHEFKLTALSGCLVLEAYSVSHGKATAYLPVIELLKSYFDIQASDDERKRREKVTGKVLNLDRTLEDTLPYLFALLGTEEQPSPLAQMDPQIRRKRTFEALKKLFLRESLNQPLVLIFEDLHWIDGETQGFLDVLSESLASAKILLLTNYRPEYRHEWGQKTYYTQLRLAPLGKAEAEEFLDALLGTPVGVGLVPAQSEGAHKGTPLQALKHLILDKTQGTPFFMEEIVQELREQGVLPVGATGRSPLPQDLHIPTTVQAVLAARIDRLASDEKALLQQLAVIGRQFPLSLIRQVITQPEADLYRLLASLQHKEFLYEQPAFPESEYIFKHALTQEVAYGTMLQEQRKLLHERTGKALETVYVATLHEHYNDLGHHYTRGGVIEKAVEYLHLAGQQAAQRSANAEAITQLTTALELLTTLPDTPARAQQELLFQTTLGPALVAARGFASAEVRTAYMRALELCQQLGETSQLFAALGGLWSFHLVRAEFQTAHEFGEQLLTLAQRAQDPTMLVVAHAALGQTFFFYGELGQAQGYFNQSLLRYDPQHHQVLTSLSGGEDPAIPSQSFLAWILWLQGYPEQALEKVGQVFHLARELNHPFSLAEALFFLTHLHQCRGEGKTVQERAEALITLSTEQGFALMLSLGMFMRGWALTEGDRQAAGLAEMQEGLTAERATGAEGFIPYMLTLLAEAYEKMGQVEEGLRVLAEALDTVDKTGERFYEAEVWRIAGELALRIGETETGGIGDKKTRPDSPIRRFPVSSPEEAFQKAIAIAQKQQAKSLELRAVMSLARLWQSQGKTTEAHDLLAPVYHWFIEGFDTKDLQEAKALLAELSH